MNTESCAFKLILMDRARRMPKLGGNVADIVEADSLRNYDFEAFGLDSNGCARIWFDVVIRIGKPITRRNDFNSGKLYFSQCVKYMNPHGL